MELTFKKTNLPIAKIIGGTYNNRIIYINDTTKMRGGCGSCNNTCGGKFYSDYEEDEESDEYSDELIEDSDSDEYDGGYLEDTFLSPFSSKPKDLDRIDTAKNKNFHINTGFLEVLPSSYDDQSDAIYVSGARRSGKSTWLSSFVKRYHEKYPHKKVILVTSTNQKDPAFKGMSYIKKLDTESLLMDPITDVEEIANSLVIFDDYENFNQKELQNEIYKLRDMILNNGRKQKIGIIISHHVSTDHNKTRQPLFECDSYVIFPQNNSYSQTNRVLSNYMGLNKLEIDRIMKLKSRWVFLKKSYPRYVVYEKGAYLL